MYPPATVSSNVIKSQSLRHSKNSSTSRVFYPSNNVDKNQGRSGKPYNQESRRPTGRSDNAWRNSGSTGSSPGASTSPSDSIPLSRESSVGSASNENLAAGRFFVRQQGELIVREAESSMKHTVSANAQQKPNSELSNAWNNSHLTSGQNRQSKNSTKPFNHKEVVDFMTQTFHEAKKAIENGNGKYYDPKESGASTTAFTPFNWENFWQQRKMNELK